MLIWFIEIPIMLFFIAAMFIGSIQPGPILLGLGIAAMIAGVIICAVAELKAEQKHATRNGWFGVLCFVQGILILLCWYWVGDHNLFEVLFGTGLF